MKAKHLLKVAGVSLFAFALAGAGALAARAQKAEPVSADDPNTWMVRFELCLGDCSPHSESCVFPEDKPVDGVRFHYWGTNVDESVDASYMFYFTHDYYGVNVALKDDQTINGCQWILEQRSEGDKYSADITKFGADDITSLNKDTDIVGIEYQYSNDWYDDGGQWKWNLTNSMGEATWYIRAEVGIGTTTNYNFVKDPANNRFVIQDVAFDAQDAIGFGAQGGYPLPSGAFDMLDDKSLEYAVSAGQHNWFWLNAGVYDFFLTNGNIMIRKQISEYVAVYLLGIDEDAYVYTFGEGGYEGFGAWPGTRLGNLVQAQEVSGDLHFGGEDLDIWYLALNVGYPAADHIIVSYVNEHGVVGNQTGDMLLVEGAAYEFVNNDDYYNAEAGATIRLLLDAEEYRNAAAGSVCNFSVPNAQEIVNRYNDLGLDARNYFDATTVYTFKRDGSDGKEWVSYRVVIEELGRIAGISPAGPSRYVPTGVNNNATTTSIIIVLTVSLSMISIATLIIIRKRKRQ